MDEKWKTLGNCVFFPDESTESRHSPPATHIPVSWSSVELVFYMWYKEHFYEHHKCAIGHQLQKGGGVYIYTTQ